MGMLLYAVFQRKGIPLVFFNRVCDDMEVPKVIVDEYDGAFRYKAALRKNNIELDEDLWAGQQLNCSRPDEPGCVGMEVYHKSP